DSQVFAVQIEPEARLELVGDHRGAFEIHHPARRETAGEHLHDFLWIDAQLGSEDERLAHRGIVDRNDDLIAGFDRLPGSGIPNMDDGFAHRLKERFGALEIFRSAPNHYAEGPVDRSFFATTNWRIEGTGAALFQRFVHLDRGC